MRGPRTSSPLRNGIIAAFVLSVVLVPGSALAQAPPEVTPNFSVTPSKSVAPWVYQMAIGAVIVGALILIFILASYLRFSPRFFGREEAPKPLPPGSRPPLLRRSTQPVQERPAVAASSAPAGGARVPAPSAARAGSATAVAERPAPAPSAVPAASEGVAAAAASTTATASPSAEPAVQADAVGQAEAAAPEAPAPRAPDQAPAPPPAAPAQPSAAPAPPSESAPRSESALDQETFDRVLQEQLEKGMDRRVAEGRARAAAVVAARKKAQR